MNKMMVAVLFCAFLLPPVTSAPAQKFSLEIWVDKGCGGEYYLDEPLIVHWKAAHPCEITFWILIDEERKELTKNPIDVGAGESYREWPLTAEYGYGEKSVYAEAVSSFGWDSAVCTFFIRKKTADIEVTVKDQHGEPLSGAEVILDTTVIGPTIAGVFTVKEVEFGEHEITVTYEGTTQKYSLNITSTEKQYIGFVFTVEKTGIVKIFVVNENGDPIEGAVVSIDGITKGQTSQEGLVTSTIPEGSHRVDVQWQDSQVGTSVTVQENQTISVNLTVETDTDIPPTIPTFLYLIPVIGVLVLILLIRTSKRGKKEKEVFLCPSCKNRIEKNVETCPYCKTILK